MNTITIHFQNPEGTAGARAVEARIGRTLMQAAVDGGVTAIAADCGGLLSCATCHVIVPPEWQPRLPGPAGDELDMLEMTAAPREAGSRLSCQIVLSAELQGLVVRLPTTQY